VIATIVFSQDVLDVKKEFYYLFLLKRMFLKSGSAAILIVVLF
jgi:hypothetical protein